MFCIVVPDAVMLKLLSRRVNGGQPATPVFVWSGQTVEEAEGDALSLELADGDSVVAASVGLAVADEVAVEDAVAAEVGFAVADGAGCREADAEGKLEPAPDWRSTNLIST
jgi:hypothetical protein